MTENERFLGLYKRLDSMLDGIYHLKSIESPVYMKEIELKKSDVLSKRERGEKYTIIRSIRNMLAHNEINLENPFEVNPNVSQFIESEIALLENKKTAMDVAVPFNSMLYARESSYVKAIAKQMSDKGITNVPILKDGKVIGVFNGHALMQIICKFTDIDITEYTKMKEIMDYTSLKGHPGIRYEFVSKDTGADDLETLFRRNSKGKTELLFVTENGSINEEILGVISPHDILEK